MSQFETTIPNFFPEESSPALLTEIEFWREQLALLRGDNLYDVSRLYYAGRGVNCVQDKLEVHIPHGVLAEDNDKRILEVFEKKILPKYNLRFIRVIMGRLICSGDHIVGALVNVKNDNTYAYYDLLGTQVLVTTVSAEFRELITTEEVPYMTRLTIGGQNSLTTSIETIPPRDNIPDIAAFYPYFEADRLPAEIWRRFMASRSNVLLLVGPPGTGKSNFALEMMEARGWDDNVNMADRQDVLLHPSLTDYIRGLPAGSVMITEDSDKLVEARSLDNENMSALLSATNGIVSRDTKLVISTNLESLSKVDKALTRGGRCFDILEFKLLTRDQAIALRESMGLEVCEFPEVLKDGISLADALNWHEKRDGRMKHAGGVGFTN